MYRLLLFFLLITICNFSIAQTLYEPRDIQQAYKNETRSRDGNPGKNYWINHARYTINITALPPDRNITGDETISYINNSSDTIKNPSIKLFINIHKPSAPRDFPAQKNYITSGVHIDAITVNGASMDTTKASNSFTNYRLQLSKSVNAARFFAPYI